MSLKTNILILWIAFFSLQVNSQEDTIIVPTDEFNHLIGKEFYDVSELGDFIETTSTSLSKSGIETRSARLISGAYTIYTSEIVSYSKDYGRKTRKILDLIVLQGYYSSCEGCLSSSNNVTLKTIHPKGNDYTEDNIIVAFSRDNETGKYKKVNPKRFTWTRVPGN